MVVVAFEIRFRPFLVAVRLDDGRFQPDARDTLQHGHNWTIWARRSTRPFS
jgi:hypothetical protein